MLITKRQLAVGVCGFCAFTNLYPIQALLPELTAQFQASAGEVGLTLSAGTLAVALMAPFAGFISDLVGRKSVILVCLAAVAIVTLLSSLATSILGLILWRFAAGLFIPGIFATTVAYIGEEWSAREAVETTAVYISGTVLGGFCGRLIAGLATEWGGWQAAFIVLGLLDLLLVPLVFYWLPASRNFRPGKGLSATLRAMAGHLGNPMLLQTFAVSFGMLFSLLAVFTYVSLRLAEPPFGLGTGAIGSLFAVYLLSVVVTPLAGRQIPKWGRAPVAVLGACVAILGLLLTLPTQLVFVITGLALFSVGLFVLQSVATGFVPQAAEGSVSAAVGLYVTAYYIGGSLGAIVPSPIWIRFGWPGCVLLVSLLLLLVAVLAHRLWSRDPHTQRMLAERRSESL